MTPPSIVLYSPAYPGSMYPNAEGRWVELQDLLKVLEYIADDDDRNAMLAKIAELKEQFS